MTPLTLSGLPPIADDHLASFCAAIPAALALSRDHQDAARALEQLVRIAKGHALPATPRKSKPDPFANLWFIHAANEFARSTPVPGAQSGGGADPAFFNQTLLPLSKKIVQEFISADGLGGVKMDDGGLLLPADPLDSLRLNTLWYAALESTAANLKNTGDRTADHFERLAGRFRRSFAKAFWCDQHSAICPPRMRSQENHGAHPDPDQTLLTLLPTSPVPRTKQRQILQLCKSCCLGTVGLLVEHPQHGLVESPLHRAWLAMGLHQTSDNNSAAAEIAAVLAPLQPLAAQARTHGLPALFKHGTAEPLPHQKPDIHTTAIVLATLHTLNKA